MSELESKFWDFEKYPTLGRPERKCYHCDGTGKAYTDADDPCTNCNETGVEAADWEGPVQQMWGINVKIVVEIDIMGPKWSEDKDDPTRQLMMAIRMKDGDMISKLLKECISIDANDLSWAMLESEITPLEFMECTE